MKLRSRIATTLTAGLVTTTLFAFPASAAEHHWANTRNNKQSNGMKVYWCAGGSSVLKPGQNTGKNICAIQVAHDHYLYVFDAVTGTVLFDTCNVDDSKKIALTTKTDTNNTAKVLYYDTLCA